MASFVKAILSSILKLVWIKPTEEDLFRKNLLEKYNIRFVLQDVKAAHFDKYTVCRFVVDSVEYLPLTCYFNGHDFLASFNGDSQLLFRICNPKAGAQDL